MATETVLIDPETGAQYRAGEVTFEQTDVATEGTLAAILAKLIAAPATSEEQDTGNTSLAAIATSIGSISDAAWVIGDGSVIAILKAIAINTAV